MFGFIRRQLVRVLVPSLRQEWRADGRAASRRLEDRIARDLSILSGRVDRKHAKLTIKFTDIRSELRTLQRELHLVQTTLLIDAEHRERRYSPTVFGPEYVGPHVAHAIAAAPLRTDPTPHLFVESLMPDDTYRALLDAIPPRPFFIRDVEKGGKSTDLKLSSADVVPEWTRIGVGFLQETLVPLMMPPLVERLRTYMPAAYAQRYGAELGARVAALPHEVTGGRLMSGDRDITSRRTSTRCDR